MSPTMDALVTFISSRYPELQGESFRIVTEGMQNTVIIVGERLVFRFPLSSDSVSLETEKRFLPKLAERVTLPIPKILFESDSQDDLQYIGYPIIQGEPLMDVHFLSLSETVKDRIAKEIADFLTSLHTFQDDPVTRNDPDESRVTWKGGWEFFFAEIERFVEPKLGKNERLWVQRMRREYLQTDGSFEFTPCLIHGDFKREHIFYDPDAERLSGIIDFGQLKVGDPAYDFHYLHLNYGERFMNSVYLYYLGPKDDNFHSRIEIYTYFLWLSELLYAARMNDVPVWNRGAAWLSSIASRTYS
ncbi:phosphotransferase family protein [Paenibacillus caui]|uniref:phosphotransferase family protein n=1 Tax=Paenibacillus caui TaxID=2873927 RepID=UPI001CA8783B|nr:phosphotransferase [Paenibacillus caui]